MSPIQRILDLFRRAYNSLSTNLIDTVKSYIQGTDKPVSSAVLAAFKAIGVTHMLQTATKESIKASYEKAIGKTIPVFPSNLASAWDASGMTLSEKIHGASKEMRQAIIDTIRAQLKTNKHAMTAARALYDGYNSGVAVTRSQSIPKYLEDILDFARHSNLAAGDKNVLLARIRQARRQVDKLAAGGAPNRALKTAYMKLLDTVEDGAEKSLDSAIHTAVQEKSRYIAERVARTESARAWAQGFADRYMDDDTVVAFRWQLAARHPRYDICNLYAEADLWGLGKGIYPKDKTPMLPVHPHCLCHLAPVFSSELEGKTAANQIEAGGRQYIEGLNRESKKKLLGVTGYEQIKDGVSWTTLARNYSSDKLGRRISKLDSERSIIKAEIKATGIKCQKVNYPPRKIDVANLIFDDNHVNIERAHHVTESMAKGMIEKAIISLQRWNGKCEIYCSLDGWVYVMDGKVIRTVFKPEEYDENVKKVQEVLKNHEDKMPNNR